jgi:predicted SAM-dependent methyltransferase
MLYAHARRRWNRLRHVYHHHVGLQRLRQAHTPLRIVIGASGYYDPGWVPTERSYLDLLKPADWERFFKPASIDAMLAEHVWEHLSPEDGLFAARVCYAYLKPGGYLRLAVPDGLHPSPEYIEWSRVGGKPPGMSGNGHQALYTYRTFGELFRAAGFNVRLYEYFNEDGRFVAEYWNPADGTIRRSRALDKRNRSGGLVYTSIIMDAVKDGSNFAWVS